MGEHALAARGAVLQVLWVLLRLLLQVLLQVLLRVLRMLLRMLLPGAAPAGNRWAVVAPLTCHLPSAATP